MTLRLSNPDIHRSIVSSYLINGRKPLYCTPKDTTDSINKDTNLLLVEPIKVAFEKLQKNYSGYKNVKFVNKAIDTKSGKRNIFSVNPKYYEFYKKK